jgi:hypothetical protein
MGDTQTHLLLSSLFLFAQLQEIAVEVEKKGQTLTAWGESRKTRGRGRWVKQAVVGADPFPGKVRMQSFHLQPKQQFPPTIKLTF